MSKKEPTKNPAAVALGKMARGVPKTLTDEQRQRKREIVAANRAKIQRKPNPAET
ncbi:MAG: hypothetical protein WCS52_02035 [bacterium]